MSYNIEYYNLYRILYIKIVFCIVKQIKSRLGVIMIIKLFAGLKDAAGSLKVEADFDLKNGNIEELLNILVKKYGDDFEELLFKDGSLRNSITIILNGKNIRFINGTKTEVSNDDKVSIIPPLFGG